MPKVRNSLRSLIVPLTMAAALQTHCIAAENTVAQQQNASANTSADAVGSDEVGNIVEYTPARQPRWYFRSEGLALKRYTPDKQQFAGRWTPPVVTPDGTTPGFYEFMLGTNDLEFEFQGGYRLAVGRKLGDWTSVEFTYFDVGDWFETAAVRNVEQNTEGTPGNLMSPFTDFGNPPVSGVDYNNFINIESSSTLDNMELNFWREHPMPPDSMGVSYMIGLRYASILEQFQYYSESAEPTPLGAANTVNTRARNKLLGVQLGALFEFPVDPGWWIDWELKGAICDNRASQHTEYVNVTQGNPTSSLTSRAEGRTTFIGETSVRVVYECSHWLMAYAGYQAIWVDGLALASENVSNDLNILSAGPGQLDHDGNLVYHGPHVGMTLIW